MLRISIENPHTQPSASNLTDFTNRKSGRAGSVKVSGTGGSRRGLTRGLPGRGESASEVQCHESVGSQDC